MRTSGLLAPATRTGAHVPPGGPWLYAPTYRPTAGY